MKINGALLLISWHWRFVLYMKCTFTNSYTGKKERTMYRIGFLQIDLFYP